MKSFELVSAANAGADITSVAVDLGDLVKGSIQCVFSSGTLNGTLYLQASNDNVNFSNITGASQAIASGAPHVFNVSDAGYQYLRVFWDWTSGTGTMTSIAKLKENPIKGA